MLGGLALVLLARSMRAGGVLGARTGLLTLAMGVLMLVPPTAGTSGLVLSLVSLLPLLPWLAIVARALWRSTDERAAPTTA